MNRIAVSADTNQGLESVVAPHFGRCPYFVLVDLEGTQTKAVQVIENPYYEHHQPGQVPAFIHSQKVDVMLSGGMGGRAIALFQQYDIETSTGASGTVRHTLEQYLGGSLGEAQPCRESVDHGCGDAPTEMTYEKNEVERLQEEVEMLEQQLDETMERIRNLNAE